MSPTVYRETTPSQRTTLRVHPEREAPEEAPAILSAGVVAHVGFEVEGQPYVIPMTYQYDPAEPTRLYLHGAPHEPADGPSGHRRRRLRDGDAHRRAGLLAHRALSLGELPQHRLLRPGGPRRRTGRGSASCWRR